MTFPIPDRALTQHTAILGKTGSGKTSTAKLVVEHVVEQGARVCIIDPIKSDWWGLTSSVDGRRPGLPFTILGGPHGHVPLHDGAGAAIAEIVASGALPLSILDMADFKAGGPNRFFTAFADTLMRRMKGVLYLVIEEAHEFAPKERSGVGDENMAIYYAKKLATAGRSKGLRMIVCTQAVQLLHNRVLGSCETMIVHRFTAPADRAPVEAWLKGNIPEKANQAKIAGSLPGLADGQGWVCSGGTLSPAPVQFPRIATFDNSATPEHGDVAHQVVTAKVDQQQLRALVGEAVKEAEENDPKVLRARIAELEKAAPAAAPSGYSEQYVRERESLGERNGFARGRAAGQSEGWKAHATAAATALAALTYEIAIPERESHEIGLTVHAQRPIAPATAKALNELGTAAAGALRRGDLQVTGPQQRILDALAWLEHKGLEGMTKHAVAAVADASPSSSTFANNLGALRNQHGLIEYPTPGTVTLTDAGRKLAQPPARNSRSLFDAWYGLSVISAPQKQILAALRDAHPRPLTKEAVANRANASVSSSTFANNLGRLRSLGAIDYPQAGMVALTKYATP